MNRANEIQQFSYQKTWAYQFVLLLQNFQSDHERTVNVLRYHFRQGYIPYILESNPHRNLIPHPVFATFLNEKKVSTRF
jgi:hypothetical protein